MQRLKGENMFTYINNKHKIFLQLLRILQLPTIKHIMQILFRLTDAYIKQHAMY